MSTKVTASIRVTPEVKEAAKEVFKELGFDFSSGIEIYLRYVARERRIPFDLDLSEKEESNG